MTARTHATNCSGGERHGEDVVHAPLTGHQFGLEVTAPRKGDGGEAPARLCHVRKACQDAAASRVDVQDDEVGLPLDKFCSASSVVRATLAVLAVMKRKLHDVGEYALLDNQ